MTTEQKILDTLRGALERHEKRPFCDIQSAVDAQKDSKASGRKTPKVFTLRRLAPALAACVVLVACAGIALHFWSRTQNVSPAADEQFETMMASTPEAAQEFGNYKDVGSASAFAGSAEENILVASTSPEADTFDMPKSEKGRGSFISPALEEQMRANADDPDFLFCVAVFPRIDGNYVVSDSEGNVISLSPDEPSLCHLTANEITKLAEEGYSIYLNDGKDTE